MNRFNKENLVKFIIIVCLSIFYIKFIVAGDILKFMHPRLLPFVKFSIILMIIISLFLLLNLSKNRMLPSNLKNYKLFIIPLLIVLLLEPNNDLKNVHLNDTKYSSQNSNEDANALKASINDNNIDCDATNDCETIVITDENYLSLLDKIYDDEDKYVNRKIQVKGFIFQDESTEQNNFVIARYVMTCCASDMHIIGFLCKDNRAYNINSWYEITGVLKKSDSSNSKDSVYIEVESSKEIDTPENQYIYL